MGLTLPLFQRSRVLQNLLANYAGTAVTALAPLLALPVLIRVLGNEAWGLVAFVNLMVAMLTMLNAGIAQALVRELGHRWTDLNGDRLRTATLLRGYERLYWVTALGIGTIVLPFIPWIAGKWLNTTVDFAGLSQASVAAAIALFVLALPASIYRGTLLAVQKHMLFNIINATAALSKAGFGVLVVLLNSSVLAYLAVLVTVAALETLSLAIAAWHFMPESRQRVPFHLREVRLTLRFSLSMSALAVLGVVCTQIDRFFVSVLLPISDLGIYSIAVSLALGVLQISYPLFTSVMPLLVSLGTDSAGRRAVTRRLLFVVLSGIAVIGMFYVRFGATALELWLGDTALVHQVMQPLSWLLLGAALNAIYNIGYTNWVSMGKVGLITWVNVLSLILIAIILPQAIKTWGMVGAASSLVIVNLVGVTFMMTWYATSQRHPEGE